MEDAYILKYFLYLVIVILILIVDYIDDMLLVTDVYYLLSLLMTLMAPKIIFLVVS